MTNNSRSFVQTLDRVGSSNFSFLSRQLVIIDPQVDDYQTLAAGIAPASEVHILDPDRDGIAQITEILSPGCSSLHIISHGTPGTLYLGNSILNRQTLGNYAPQLQQWALDQLYIYGCEVAAGIEGQQFLQQLHEQLPIAIYANPHPTGNSALGGTWTLQQMFPQWEQEDGNWEWVLCDGTHNKGQKTKDKKQSPSNSSPFSPHTLATYAHTLGLGTYTNFPVGTWPESVAIGDVNGDGHDDLAVANQNSNNVSILLGDGSGGFGTQTTFPAGNGPYSGQFGRLQWGWEVRLGGGERLRRHCIHPLGRREWQFRHPNPLPRRSCSDFRQRGRLKRGWQR